MENLSTDYADKLSKLPVQPTIYLRLSLRNGRNLWIAFVTIDSALTDPRHLLPEKLPQFREGSKGILVTAFLRLCPLRNA